MSATAAVHARLPACGLLPAAHWVDSGQVNAELMAGSRRHSGVCLEGPVRGLAESISWVVGGFGRAHFSIHRDAQRVASPQDKQSVG